MKYLEKKFPQFTVNSQGGKMEKPSCSLCGGTKGVPKLQNTAKLTQILDIHLTAKVVYICLPCSLVIERIFDQKMEIEKEKLKLSKIFVHLRETLLKSNLTDKISVPDAAVGNFRKMILLGTDEANKHVARESQKKDRRNTVFYIDEEAEKERLAEESLQLIKLKDREKLRRREKKDVEFQCSDCLRVFKLVRQLRTHIYYIHLQNREVPNY